MTTTTAAIAAPSTANPIAFWERAWRKNGLQFVVLSFVTLLITGVVPGINASADALFGFYGGNSMGVILGGALAGGNLLAILWFAASIRTTLAQHGKDGWG